MIAQAQPQAKAQVKVIHEQHITTLFCDDCGKKRPFRLDCVTANGFTHQCIVCGNQTAVKVGGLRRSDEIYQQESLFDRLHAIIMRDMTQYHVLNNSDHHFFMIAYQGVGGVDDYTVEYYDYKPVEIIHRGKRMAQGHTFYPWLSGGVWGAI